MKSSESAINMEEYRPNEPIEFSGIPKEQIFSDEVDSTWVDKLGITHKTFKQNNYEFE
jgi:hypothetical protein